MWWVVMIDDGSGGDVKVVTGGGDRCGSQTRARGASDESITPFCPFLGRPRGQGSSATGWIMVHDRRDETDWGPGRVCRDAGDWRQRRRLQAALHGQSLGLGWVWVDCQGRAVPDKEKQHLALEKRCF
jgi:hypothetical protein